MKNDLTAREVTGLISAVGRLLAAVNDLTHRAAAPGRRDQRACRMLLTETLANRGRGEHPAEQAITAVTAKFGAETTTRAAHMLTAFLADKHTRAAKGES